MEFREPDPVVVPPGEGEVLKVLGETLTCKLTGDDVGGTYSLFLAETPPKGGTPLHMHHREDETLCVLEGEFEVQCGDGHFKAPAGATVFLPRDIPHAWRNLSNAPGRLLLIASPSGVEVLWKEMHTLEAAGNSDPQKMAKIARKHGVDLIGPAMWQKTAGGRR